MLFLRAPFISFVLTTMLMGLFYADELSRPNDYYLSDAGDGLKNYYTLAYHQQYDSSFSHFSGMAYPYGEHIVFTDGQPSLALILWLIPTLGPYSVAILNLLLLLGVGLCAWILCKLFIRTGMTRGSSLFAASAIALLSPQILRFNAHYALAYCFVIPWILYTAYIFVEKPSIKRGLWVFIAVLVICGLHLYYFLMAAAFIGIFYLIEALRRKNMPLWKYFLSYIVQVIIPFGLYLLWMKATDPVSDRPSIPYGMREYMALWEGVFLPLHEFGIPRLFQRLDVRPINAEAIAYVGLPAVLYFIYFLISRIKLLFLKKGSGKFLKAHSIFLSGFLVFLLAATLPFAMDTSWGARYGGPLLQFRSLGRLSWVFYYCLNIFLFLQLAGRRKRWGMALSSLATLVLFLEGLYFHSTFSPGIGDKRTIQPGQDQLASFSGHVLFPLPYFHVGSENLNTRHDESYLAEQTMALSLASGMPTYGSMMSRTSLHQTLQHFELAWNLSGPLMNETKPWLITRAPGYSNRVSRLLPNAPDAILDTIQLYSITQGELIALKEKTRPEEPARDSTPPFLFYDDFSDGKVRGIAGGGGLLLPYGQKTILYEGTGFNDTLSLFLWLDARNDGFRFYHLLIENTGTGEKWEMNPGMLIDNVVDGFARIHLNSQYWNFPCRLSVSYTGPVDQELVVDECILIREGHPFQYSQNNFVFTNEFVFKPGR
ncbi:MAG: hypothetical protein ACYC1Q_08610 [Bacteroidia bacterium]